MHPLVADRLPGSGVKPGGGAPAAPISSKCASCHFHTAMAKALFAREDPVPGLISPTTVSCVRTLWLDAHVVLSPVRGADTCACVLCAIHSRPAPGGATTVRPTTGTNPAPDPAQSPLGRRPAVSGGDAHTPVTSGGHGVTPTTVTSRQANQHLPTLQPQVRLSSILLSF